MTRDVDRQVFDDPAQQIDADERARWQTFYDDRARPCPFFVQAPDENLAAWLREGALAPGRALDIGCGIARNAIHLARHGFGVDAIDVSASAVQWASEEVRSAGVPVAVHHVSFFDFAFQPASYDLVYDGGCFHHIPPHQRDAYVQRVASALKPGGAFGLVCFAPEGGSGYTDEEVVRNRSLGGGLGYDEARLRQIWGGAFDVRSVRRMRELPRGAPLFGKDFLWVLLATRR